MLEHNGIKVSYDCGGIRVQATVNRPSWIRMDKAGWPLSQMDGFMRQTDREIAEALRIYRDRI